MTKKKTQNNTKVGKSRRQKPKVTRPPPESIKSTYLSALTNPFSPKANGARVPDYFCVPTTTKRIKRRFTLSTDSNGEADVVILPSALYHACSARGSIANGAVWDLQSGVANNVTNGLLKTDSSALGGQLVNYRIVGFGVRIMSTTSSSADSGVCLVAKAPVSSWLNTRQSVGFQSDNSSNALSTAAATFKAYGFPAGAGGLDLNALPSLPTSSQMSLEAMDSPIEVNPKLTSPEAFEFRQADDSAVGYNITTQTSTSWVTSGDASRFRVAGFEAIAVGISGAPSSTKVADIEVIYHLEGAPFIVTTADQMISSDSATSAVDPIGWMDAIAIAARSPDFKRMALAASDYLLPGSSMVLSKVL